MNAVIYQVEERPWAAMLPVAGQPLVVRQIEWLIAAGFKQIAIEVSGPSGDSIERQLLREGAMGGKTRIVRSPRMQGARLAARKAGFGGEAPVLAVPGDFLADGDFGALLREATGEVSIELDAPLDGLRSGALRVIGPRGARSRVQAPGWGVHLRSPEDALLLSSAALSGQLPARGGDHLWPILVHGAETSPGVWVARGARVDERARLIAPVFIGGDAIICMNAEVGPGALIGERAVVERGARISEAVVARETVVGEGVRIERALAAAGGLYDLAWRRPVRLSDPLLLGIRVQPPSSIGQGSRAVALVVSLLLAAPALLAHFLLRWRGRASFRAGRAVCCGAGPVTLDGLGESAIVDLLCRLIDVARGERPLADVAQEQCPRCRGFAMSLAELGAESEPRTAPDPVSQQRIGRGRL